MGRAIILTSTFAAAALASLLLPAAASAQPPRPLAQNLTEAHARARAERVSNVRYELEFRLSASLPEYAGSVITRFDLTEADTDLTLDFFGGTIYSLIINGQETASEYNDFFITLPATRLRAGPNELVISFSHPYSSDGSGLYRFTEPEDGRTYLYTDFEPYDQNRLFPSFDQPNLKARYTTRVTAPASWQVVANTRETAVLDDGDERIWHFPETLPISTYVYALHAGDYHVWESAAGEIPLRLLARESLVPFVDPEHWFLPTRQGLSFYQAYFETPYPFGKYDQVIVPHFNSGAMENVAAVTFSERYLSRGAVTRQNRRSITSVILHEMAHMWFGDLVTMDWWNGLWLNESFATVMAVLAMTEATEFDDEWLESFRDTIRAYLADERDTTHPIELEVPDTDSAFANFDRITYEKGSATLVQLMHLVGPESFRRGVGAYLDTHAFGNTTIVDFLDAISRTAGVDLQQWARDWLLEPGTNTVEVEFECTDGTLTELTIVQGAPARWPTLRTHRTQLGLYRFEDGSAQIDTLPVTYAGPLSTVPAAAGQPCPDLVYANHDDWDYVRVRLDDETLQQLDGRLHLIDDPLARLMLWQSAWDAVLDARTPIIGFVTFALDNLDAETSEGAVRQVLGALASAASYLDEMPDPGAPQAAARERLEQYLWRRVNDAEPASDLQLLFYDVYVSVAKSRSSLGRLASILSGRTAAPAGLRVDQDRRWSLVALLAASGSDAAESLIAAESERDRTDEGRRHALTAAAARPDQALKAATIAALLDPARISNLAEYRAVAGGLFPRGQHGLQLANSQAALAGLARLNRTRDAAFYSAYVNGLAGPVCHRGYLEQLDAAIAGAADLHPLILRSLRDSRFETDRCLRIAARQHEALADESR